MTTDADFLTLEALSRRAAEHSLAATGSHVDEDDRADSLALHLLEAGLRAWQRFDPDGYPDVSRATYAYRAMRGYRGGTFTEGPTIDWLRRTVRDRRFEPEIATVLAADGTLPDVALEHDQPLELAARSLGGHDLTLPARRTLETLVVQRARTACTLREAADRVGITYAEARDRIRELRRELIELGLAPEGVSIDDRREPAGTNEPAFAIFGVAA